jgi:hypothetical protein
MAPAVFAGREEPRVATAQNGPNGMTCPIGVGMLPE